MYGVYVCLCVMNEVFQFLMFVLDAFYVDLQYDGIFGVSGKVKACMGSADVSVGVVHISIVLGGHSRSNG